MWVCACKILLILVVVGSLADPTFAGPGDVPASPTQGQEARVPVPRPMIALQDDLLSVKIHNTPWKEVLQELTHQTGIKIRVMGPLVGTVTQEFESLPLEQGLQRLFQEVNFVLSYAKGSRRGTAEEQTVQVWLFPKESGASEAKQAHVPFPGRLPAVQPVPEDPPGTVIVVPQEEPASDVVILGEDSHETSR